MKKLTATAVLFLMAPAWMSAQKADTPGQGEAYIFIGPIVSNTQYMHIFNPPYASLIEQPKRGGVNTGFGGDFIYRGLGVGFEAAYAAPNWSFGTDGDHGRGVVSIDASYYFFSKKNHRRIEPFVVGGYSLYYGDRTDTQNGFNIGGGINLWVAKHAALRLEVRDHEHTQYYITPFPRFVAFRIGVTFR